MPSGLGIGMILASVDVICFGFCKYILTHNLPLLWLLLPAILYGSQIFLFYYGLTTNTVATLNITWDVLSSIFVAIIGILYFKEALTNYQLVGIILGIISIFLFSL